MKTHNDSSLSANLDSQPLRHAAENAALIPVSPLEKQRLDYPLTNDYMFRSVMQSNENVLKGLLCALLHLNSEDVVSIQILNPIELGDTIREKEFYLDIKLLMNDRAVINLEMQLRNEHNWPERSLIYLCRLFSRLNKGEDYDEIKPAFQIGILSFTPFPKFPEFYATHKLMNVKNYHKYSDNFTLHVLDLTQIDHATKEDKDYKIDQWARLFKTKTWEDFKMIAADDQIFQELGETLFKLNADEKIRYQCEAREEYWRIQNTTKRQLEKQGATIEEQKTAIAKKDSTIAEQRVVIADKDSTIAQKNSTIAQKEAAIVELKETVARLQAELRKEQE